MILRIVSISVTSIRLDGARLLQLFPCSFMSGSTKSPEKTMQPKQTLRAGYYLAQLSVDCGHESLLSANTLICDVIKRQSLASLQWQWTGDRLCGHGDSTLRWFLKRMSYNHYSKTIFFSDTVLPCHTKWKHVPFLTYHIRIRLIGQVCAHCRDVTAVLRCSQCTYTQFQQQFTGSHAAKDNKG